MPGPCICSGLSVANCLRQLCPLGTRSLSAQASVCGSRTVGCPEFIRGIQFRPLGRNSLTTFRGQTALRGCPRARGVRCRIAPYRSLCSPPTLPAGRFGLRPRPHWGHASLRDSSLRSPAGKKPFIAHFAGGARNVARDIVGELSPSFVRTPMLAFFPPLPIAARFPHSWRWADLNGDAWDASVCWGDAAAQKNRLGFDSADGINHTHNGNGGWNVAT